MPVWGSHFKHPERMVLGLNRAYRFSCASCCTVPASVDMTVVILPSNFVIQDMRQKTLHVLGFMTVTPCELTSLIDVEREIVTRQPIRMPSPSRVAD